jgi:predicted enzyme involved in methoxymalonyl-ACP biosynthesis
MFKHDKLLKKSNLNSFKICDKKKLKSIFGEYKFSEKNSLVSELYKELGFNIIFDSNNYKKYSFEINKYKNKNTYVKEV